jgi:hypothetical protein
MQHPRGLGPVIAIGTVNPLHSQENMLSTSPFPGRKTLADMPVDAFGD